ncbi:MAG: flavodoxin family protein [Deferribacteraceae bacterium]|jgi:multimeric flavodoxin WrbA|nr:flavodoxin family protein [Deferribacteraceae bacterium]
MILLIEASPRKNGNGAYIAAKIFDRFKDKGVTRFRLSEMDFKDCLACRSCKKNDSVCITKDDMQKIYPFLLDADTIILISPSYYGFVNGEAKKFIDRLYCMKKADKTSRYKEGAKLVFLLTMGKGNRDRGNFTQEWLKQIADNSSLKFYGVSIPNCSFDNTDGALLKAEEVLMGVSFFGV